MNRLENWKKKFSTLIAQILKVEGPFEVARAVDERVTVFSFAYELNEKISIGSTKSLEPKSSTPSLKEYFASDVKIAVFLRPVQAVDLLTPKIIASRPLLIFVKLLLRSAVG